MKRAYLAILPLLVSCESKQVEMYSKQLESLLAEYQAGVTSRIQAERKLYADMAQRHAVEAERDVYESLKVERLHQQRVLTAALAEKRMTASQVQERMREAAMLELDKTKTFFEQELQIETNYQAGLAKVALDAKKIQALGLALKAMRENKGLSTALSDVEGFAGAFQKEFVAQECKSLAREIATKAESLKLLKAEPQTDEVKALVAKLTAEQAALTAQKCP